MEFGKDVRCALVCQKNYTHGDASAMERLNFIMDRIKENFMHYWLVVCVCVWGGGGEGERVPACVCACVSTLATLKFLLPLSYCFLRSNVIILLCSLNVVSYHPVLL